MVDVKFLDDHNAGNIEYHKDDIIEMDLFAAKQLQSHGIVQIVPDKAAAIKKVAADKKALKIINNIL